MRDMSSYLHLHLLRRANLIALFNTPTVNRTQAATDRAKAPSNVLQAVLTLRRFLVPEHGVWSDDTSTARATQTARNIRQLIESMTSDTNS